MPQPPPSQILSQTREHYVSRLRTAIDDHDSEGIVQVVAEAALRDAKGELLRRGELAVPVRVDLITLVDGQVRDGMNIDPQTMPGFEPIHLRWKHEWPITIWPFPWNAMAVILPGTDLDLTPLSTWFLNWFDPEDTRQPGDDGVLGVVHSILITPAPLGSTRLLIDLGSAPVDALLDMFDALHAMRLPSLQIGAPISTLV
jgi:hypothetical protein